MSTTKILSCLCRRVRLTVTGADKGAVACHCINCQKKSGSAFAYNHFMMGATVKYESGEDLVKLYEDKDTKSGHALHRAFCTNCGGSLFAKPDQTKGLIVMSAGSIEGEKTAPKREFFKENREGWLGDLAAGKARM